MSFSIPPVPEFILANHTFIALTIISLGILILTLIIIALLTTANETNILSVNNPIKNDSEQPESTDNAHYPSNTFKT